MRNREKNGTAFGLWVIIALFAIVAFFNILSYLING